MDKKRRRSLLADVDSVMQKYTGLSILNNRRGEIIGVAGRFWLPEDRALGEWDIQILMTHGYPFSFPLLRETSGLIPVCDDRHMNKGQLACTDNTYKANLRARKGISLLQFCDEFVVRFFKWQLLYECEEHRPFLQSWGHRNDGLREFIFQVLENSDCQLILLILEYIKARQWLGRNEPCICGSGKHIKRCHLEKIQILRHAILPYELANAIDMVRNPAG